MLEILVVDDREEDLLFAEKALREARVLNPVRLFKGAGELLTFLMQTRQETGPLLLLLAMVLPPWNGINLLQAVKMFPRAQRLVAVIVTDLKDALHMERAYAAGAITYLLKPISSHDIQNFLRVFGKHLVTRELNEGVYIEEVPEEPRKEEQAAS